MRSLAKLGVSSADARGSGLDIWREGQTISLIHPPVPAPYGPFNGLIWPKDGCASSAYATTAGPDFLPLPSPTPRAARGPRIAVIPRETTKPGLRRPPLRCGRNPHPIAPARRGPRGDVASLAFGLPIAIEAAMVRAQKTGRRRNMATIGTFKKTGTNEFTGDIVTLSVQARGVRIVPDTRATGENAPSHRVLVGRAEIGAAWSKRSAEGRDYLGLKLDDPSFTAAIYANLFDDDDGENFSLIWSRPNGRRGD